MRFIAILVLLIGAAVAGGAVYIMLEREKALAEMLASQRPAREAPAIEMVDVIVAAKPMRYGEVLDAKAVKLVQYPKESAPANAFAVIEDLLGPEGSPERRIVLRAMEPNEPVLKSKVTGFGERATISAQLEPGMRAFTLRIDVTSGVGGFVLPNDRVDIFLTTGSREGLKSNVIMQNVKVIAVDQLQNADNRLARVSRTATVEVSPEDAQRLSLAQQMGRISLSLRKIDETETKEDAEAVDIRDIIKQEEVAAPPPPVAPKPLCVRKGVELICQ